MPSNKSQAYSTDELVKEKLVKFLKQPLGKFSLMVTKAILEFG